MKPLSELTSNDLSRILRESSIRKDYYIIYHKILSASQWIKSIYIPNPSISKNSFSGLINSIRKLATDLLELADDLENKVKEYNG